MLWRTSQMLQWGSLLLPLLLPRAHAAVKKTQPMPAAKTRPQKEPAALKKRHPDPSSCCHLTTGHVHRDVAIWHPRCCPKTTLSPREMLQKCSISLHFPASRISAPGNSDFHFVFLHPR
jgi:hypothetical protein